jgi:hypothetical protein
VEIQFGSAQQRRRLIGQVDGGSGHSGQRAPDLHFGLGDLQDGDRINISIRWRSLSGKIHETLLEDVRPGWHTVMLADPTSEDSQ